MSLAKNNSTPTISTFKDKIFKFLEEILKNRAGIDITDSTTQEDLKSQIVKCMTMFIFLLVSSFIVFYAATDPKVLTTRMFYYMGIIVLPILFGIYFTSSLFKKGDSESPIKMLYACIGLIVIIICSYYYTTASKSTLVGLNAVTNIIVFFIIIVGLAIFYYIFSNYLKTQSGGVGFFINLIFYIPCLITDFISYIKKEIGITPNIVFILFMIELLLVLMYLLFPKITNFIVKSKKNLLMNNPIYLNQTLIIAESDKFILTKDPYNNKINTEVTNTINFRNSNYSVSFWVYVNSNTSTSSSYVEEKNIFNYANGKPKLVYLSDGLNNVNKFIVYFTNSNKYSDGTDVPKEKQRYEITAPTQRWNYFVFNYYDSKADLFVNGVLERTFYFGELTPLDGKESDNITIGDENGISGAICNVSYFPNTLTSFDISKTYNLLMLKNPPIFIE